MTTQKQDYKFTNTGRIYKGVYQTDYLVIPNTLARSEILTLEEKGLLISILSLPPDWAIYQNNLHTICNATSHQIRKNLKALIVKGYILRENILVGNMRRGYNYYVFPEPQ